MTAPDQYISIEGMKIRYRVYPAYADYGVNGKSQNKRRGKIRGRVLVLPGFTEFIEKHEAQALKFAAMGLEAVCLDWPSQGLSTRLSPGFPQLVHSDGFHQHLAALTAVMKASGFDRHDLPLLIFGHSMGGHLALRYAYENKAHSHIKGVMLIAPMIMPPVKPGRLVSVLVNFLCSLGLATRPLFFRQDDLKSREFHPNNVLTRDPEGYQFQYEWFNRNPDLKVTGPSFGWVRAAYQSCLAYTANPKILRQINLPVEAHLAGDERVVDAEASASYLPELQRGIIHIYPEARHELMQELPATRDLIWERLEAFVNGQLKA